MLNRLLGLGVGAEIGRRVVVCEGAIAEGSFSFRFCFFVGRSSISTGWAEACLEADSVGGAGMVIMVAAGVDGLSGCMVGKDTAARAFGPYIACLRETPPAAPEPFEPEMRRGGTVP